MKFYSFGLEEGSFQNFPQTNFELPCGLLRKGDGRNLIERRFPPPNQGKKSFHQKGGFPGTGSGLHGKGMSKVLSSPLAIGLIHGLGGIYLSWRILFH
jgi:hypothetical protein